MTIHRAKGLEFPIVCVADLGRGGVCRAPARADRRATAGSACGWRGRDRAPSCRRSTTSALGDEQIAADEAEERRLFYVAMTRAQERLILSGAARMDTWQKANRAIPVDWIVPAFVPDVAARVADDVIDGDGVRLTFIRDDVERVSGRYEQQGAPT